jgi:bifunctional ADP-heptose synthase (sugar kinase/adenylyltransferase)
MTNCGLKSLAALESVDYVAIIPYPAAVEAIEAVRPEHLLQRARNMKKRKTMSPATWPMTSRQ